MGTLRVLVPASIAADRRVMSTMHMIRFDSMPWPCRVEIDKSLVTLHRLVNHSGQVCLAYPVSQQGELTLRTGTLPERDQPYSLPVELARGTIDRLRNQLSMWREAGLQVPSEIDSATEQAVEALGAAVMLADDFDRQVQMADTALGFAIAAIFDLCHQFSRQVAAMRREEVEPRTKLGIRLAIEGTPADWLAQIGPDFQYICISEPLAGKDSPPSNRSMATLIASEAVKNRRKVMIGPVWDAAKTGLPDRINDITHFDTKRSAAQEHFKQLLSQIDEQPDWLYAASGLNGIGHKFLSYPQQMQLVVDLLQTVDHFNRQVPIMISFDHPWSERLAWSVGAAQGLQMADILLRHDVRVSGLGLEINLDYWPLGSLPRDPLQWLELIDTWSQFALPLFLMLRIPTGQPQSVGELERSNPIRNSFTGQQKWNYVDAVLSVALSRPFVQAVVWNDWHDSEDSPFPLAGLFDSQGRRKPIFSLLTTVYERLASSGE